MREKLRSAFIVHWHIDTDDAWADDGQLACECFDDVASDALSLTIRPYCELGDPAAIGTLGPDDDGNGIVVFENHHGVAGPQADQAHLLTELGHRHGGMLGEVEIVACIQSLDNHRDIFRAAETI
jgi:hypothetical protein